MGILKSIVIYYLILLALFALSLVLVLNEGWKRRGLLQTTDEASKTAREMLTSDHWTARLFRTMYAITFFYYCIPVTLYEHFARKNPYATFIDPHGKHGKRQ